MSWELRALAVQFCAIMNVLMAKFFSDVFLGVDLQHVRLCLSVWVCQRERESETEQGTVREIWGLCIMFSRKAAAVIAITIKIIHIPYLCVCISLSLLFIPLSLAL